MSEFKVIETQEEKVALQYGLPIDLANRLQGDDEDGLKVDAERLASFIKPSQPQPPTKSNEPIITDQKEAGWIEMARNLVNKGE